MRNTLIVSFFSFVAAACSSDAPNVPNGSAGAAGGPDATTAGGSGGGRVSAGGTTTTASDATTGSNSNGGGGSGTVSPMADSAANGDVGASNDAMGGSAGSGGGNPNDASAGGSSADARPDNPMDASTGNQESGSTNMGGIAAALDGLRLDDACEVAPSKGVTCKHASGATFDTGKTVTIGGVAGTTYNVKIRVRGLVEDQQYNGGSQPDTKVPFNIGGTESLTNYERWRITVSLPMQSYYLNQFHKAADIINTIDYTVTIPMAGKSTVTLDGYDSNDHEIYNYSDLTVTGVPGPMNKGQFVQLNVVSVTAQ